MQNKNKFLLSLAAATVIGGSLLSATRVSAQTETASTGPMNSLVQKLADKFGLNQDEVQAVFDESRAEMESQRQAEYESRLSQLVTDGKITEQQKQLILAKSKELRTKHQEKMESMKNKTDEERRAAMEAEHAALKAWADQNGIDLKYLMIRIVHTKHGPGLGRDKMIFRSTSDAPAQSIGQ